MADAVRMLVDGPDGFEVEAAGIVFDLDGVLVESGPCWEIAERRAVAALGGRWPRTRPVVDGRTSEVAVGLLAPRCGLAGREAELQHEIERVAVEVFAECVTPVAQAPRVVAELEGAPIAIATNSPRALAETSLAAAGFERMTDVVVTADEIAAGKPAPDTYLAACARLGWCRPAPSRSTIPSPGSARRSPRRWWSCRSAQASMPTSTVLREWSARGTRSGSSRLPAASERSTGPRRRLGATTSDRLPEDRDDHPFSATARRSGGSVRSRRRHRAHLRGAPHRGALPGPPGHRELRGVDRWQDLLRRERAQRTADHRWRDPRPMAHGAPACPDRRRAGRRGHSLGGPRARMVESLHLPGSARPVRRRARERGPQWTSPMRDRESRRCAAR
jgi:beta-phosphoglucomutase-like phosphatase (HAD superfamily)